MPCDYDNVNVAWLLKSDFLVVATIPCDYDKVLMSHGNVAWVIVHFSDLEILALLVASLALGWLVLYFFIIALKLSMNWLLFFCLTLVCLY